MTKEEIVEDIFLNHIVSETDEEIEKRLSRIREIVNKLPCTSKIKQKMRNMNDLRNVLNEALGVTDELAEPTFMEELAKL